MKSLKKRIITTALAGTMALSLAAPAFAATTNTSTKVTATYSEIPIDVVVPTTATVQLNPMGMPVKLPTSGSDSTAQEVATQLVSMPAAIINKSSMDLTVGATVTGTVKGNFKFATMGWSSEAETQPTANQAFVYLEMKKAEDGALNSEKTAVDADGMATQWVAWDSKEEMTTADAVKAATDGTDNDAIIVLSTKAVSNGAQGLVKLDAAVAGDDDKLVPQAGSVGLFRLDGQVVESPKTAWAKTDGFGATIAFTFKASKPETT